ncbi:MAG: hypothetical protein ACYC0C_05055 [Devosia sp.]
MHHGDMVSAGGALERHDGKRSGISLASAGGWPAVQGPALLGKYLRGLKLAGLRWRAGTSLSFSELQLV